MANGLIVLDDELHCFNVHQELESCPPEMISRMEEKLLEIVEDEEFKFKTIILKLILAHENALVKKYAESQRILQSLENEIQTLINNDCKDPVFEKVSTALLNVIKTCKIYVNILENKPEKAREILPTVISSANLDKSNRAAVYGIRAMIFIEYGLYGHKIALENSAKAKEIDPKNPYWHFLYGKTLGRIRRVEQPYVIPSDKERSALQTAIDMEQNYLFMLFTAENYLDTACKTYRFHSQKQSLYPALKLDIDNLNEEASRLFRKCLEIQPNCSHVLFRAAKGFLNLPHPMKDPERARELLLKGLKNNPRNPYGNHMLARYYERFGANTSKAMEHLMICREQNVFPAEMDLLRLEYSKDRNAFYVLERLQQLLEIYREAPRRLQILTQMASYYIFIDSNLPMASKLIKEAITMNYDDNISNHRSLFLRVREPFSILDVLIDEMKISMEKNCEPDTKKTFEAFICDMKDSTVKILPGRGKNFKDDILKEDRELRSTGNFQRKYAGSNAKSRPIVNRPRTFTRNRPNSFQKPAPRQPAFEQKIEKARSVQEVDDVFASYLNDDCKTKAKPKAESYNDRPTPNDSRYSSSRGKSNNFRPAKTDTVDDLEFDRLNISTKNSPKKRYESYDSDRDSVSSRSSGRGRATYVASKMNYDRGDFAPNGSSRGRGKREPDAINAGRGRGRPSASLQQPAQYDRPPSPSWRRNTSTNGPDVRKTSNAPRKQKESDSESEEDLMSFFRKK